MKPLNSKQKGEYYPQAKRVKTTKNVFCCYNCEQEFQPISKGHKFCAKCSEDRPIVNRVTAVDHNYAGKKKVAVAPSYRSGPSSVDDQSKFSTEKDKKKVGSPFVFWSIGKPSVIDNQSKSVPENQPSISSVAVVPKGSSLVADHQEINSFIAKTNSILGINQQPKNGLTKPKEVTVVIDQVKEENLSSNITSESETKTSKHCLASSPTAKDRRTSGILLAEIDLSTSSGDESNNDEKKQETLTCKENDTSSQATKETGDSCSESHLLTKQQPPVSSHPTLLLKSKEKSVEQQDNSDLSIQNVVPVLSNQKLGFSQLELDELRGKEEELKEMISSRTLDYDEISSLKKRIIELKSQYSTEKEILLSKEGVGKSCELKVRQAQSVVETFTEEKDSLRNHVTKTSAVLELVRSSRESTEIGIGQFKRKLEDAKDNELSRDYVLAILARKEERATDAEAKFNYTVFQLEKAENELKNTEEALKTKEAVHQEALVQWERVKSELVELRDVHAFTDQEIKLAQSRLNSLRQVNNQESIIKHFERKSQLVEIQHKIEALEHEEKLESQRKEFKRLHEIKFDVITKELDAERKSTIQLLS